MLNTMDFWLNINLFFIKYYNRRPTNCLFSEVGPIDKLHQRLEEKHAEWTVRVEMRSQELEGVSKALDILSADENRALFARSIKPGVANTSKNTT